MNHDNANITEKFCQLDPLFSSITNNTKSLLFLVALENIILNLLISYYIKNGYATYKQKIILLKLIEKNDKYAKITGFVN